MALEQRISFTYTSSADGTAATATATLQVYQKIAGHWAWRDAGKIPCHIEQGKVTFDWNYTSHDEQT